MEECDSDYQGASQFVLVLIVIPFVPVKLECIWHCWEWKPGVRCRNQSWGRRAMISPGTRTTPCRPRSRVLVVFSESAGLPRGPSFQFQGDIASMSIQRMLMRSSSKLLYVECSILRTFPSRSAAGFW